MRSSPPTWRLSHAASLTLLAGAALALSACGGSSDDSSPAPTPETAASKCEALTGLSLPASFTNEATQGARVISASYRVAKADAPNAANTAMVMGTPDYCEVKVEILPVDPQAPKINSQVNLPDDWNGKKLQFGGSGYNGALVTGLDGSRGAPAGTPLPLTRGYMTAGTDSGHQNAEGVEPQAFALNAEALENFAYAAYKKTHDLAVALGQAHYGSKPTLSYYMGGSEGGREGLMMAQRYPQDYDGIIVIDPVMNWSGLQTFGNYVGGMLQQQTEGGWLGGKVALVAETVLRACDAMDGIEDGVVSNYLNCGARASEALQALACDVPVRRAVARAPAEICLSAAELRTLEAAYSGYTFDFPLANGMTQYRGFSYGGEALPGNWNRWMTGDIAPIFDRAPNASGIGNLFNYGNGYVRYFIAQDKDFNPLEYDPNAFMQRVQAVSAMMDATDPDLSAFHARGGKMILRENMSDGAQAPLNGLTYWTEQARIMGQTTRDSFFLAYAAPGLPHTSNGVAPGTDNAPAYGIPGQIDLLAQLENWVEKQVAPQESLTLTLTQALPPYEVITSKPMCKVPLVPFFIGVSGVDDPAKASSYRCIGDLG